MRIGLIGAGNMGRVHAEAYAAIDGVEIAGVTARTPGRAGLLAQQHGAPIFPDLDALLSDDSIEAVDVTVPTARHEEVVTAALAAGKHVFCETPFARDAAAGGRMRDVAQAADRLLQVALLGRVAQPGARLREAVQSGELGEIEHAEFYRLAPVPDQPSPGDALEEILLIDLDLITWLWGRPNSVRAGMDRVEGAGIETAAVSMILDGLWANVSGGFGVPAGSPLNTTLRVAGKDAELSATLMVFPDAPPSLTCLLTRKGGTPERLPLVPENPYLTECRHFVDCLRGDADPALLSAESALPALEVLDAARLSIVAGGRVRLE
jgi:UDP-N-acetylglucosamine 3-dehydrogenase